MCKRITIKSVWLRLCPTGVPKQILVTILWADFGFAIRISGSNETAYEYSSYHLYICVVQNSGTGEQFVCCAVNAYNTVAEKTQL